MTNVFETKLARFTAASAAALTVTTAASAAVMDVVDGGFSSIDGATGRVDDNINWFESSVAADYSDYFIDPSTNLIGFGPQFPGWAGGGIGILEAATPYIYQSIGTRGSEISVQVDWLSIERTVTSGRGVTISIYSNATPLAGADGSSLASLGATLVGAETRTATDLGLPESVSAFGTAAGSVTIDISSVDVGDSLYLEITPDADGSNMAGIDDIVVTGIIPEPNSLALLGLGGLCALRRRR